jgi:hypothetical protein
MNNSTQNIRDVVAPLFSGTWEEGTFTVKQLEGTVFLFGHRGYAMTAGHLMGQIDNDANRMAVCFVNRNNQWVPIKVDQFEVHPTEDVAVLKLAFSAWGSWLVISSGSVHQTAEYDSWGYPISIAELAARYEEEQLLRPDLVYTRGYVRRRISQPLPVSIFIGTSFYELSEQAGNGCSGGPVIERQSVGSDFWRVMGVYIGESDAGFAASYAVRSDAFHDWQPEILGHSVQIESEQHADN